MTDLPLDIGVSLPLLASGDRGIPDVREPARLAEELGFDSVWAADHLSTGVPIMEVVVALSAAAAVTERVKLGTGVLQLAMRQPALIATQLAAVQSLSGGRLVLGVGVGGEWPREWAAAGIPMAGRGRRTDAMLELLPSLLGGLPTELSLLPGAPRVTLAPAVGMPPLWIGGASHHALQRVVRFGAGWLASLQPIPAMEQAARRLTTLAAQAGGPTPPMGTLVFAALTADGNPAPGRRLVRHLVDTYGRSPELADELVVAGDPAALAERLAALHDLGVRQFVLSGYGADFSEQYRLLARGADELRRRLAHGRVGASRSP